MSWPAQQLAFEVFKLQQWGQQFDNLTTQPCNSVPICRNTFVGGWPVILEYLLVWKDPGARPKLTKY
jgi:hypothetical protein